MEEDKLWKITTSDSRNVALNAKTEMNDFEQLNYGSESLWEEWIWRSMKMVALKANRRKWWLWTPMEENGDFECLNWKTWLWAPKIVEVTLNTNVRKWWLWKPKLENMALNT